MLIRNLFLTGACVIILSSCSCSTSSKPDKKNGTENTKEVAFADEAMKTYIVTEATATINPVKEKGPRGTVSFTQTMTGVKVIADIYGLTPGKHGFHIHEHGDCGGEDASAAGGHFNPEKTKHGGPDSAERHAGDLGNIVADEHGHGHYERLDKIISLGGENSIIGHSVIIHEGEDDFVSQPAGNSGAKVGCGIIKAIAPSRK